MIILRQKEYARSWGLKTLDGAVALAQNIKRGVTNAAVNSRVAANADPRSLHLLSGKIKPVSKVARAREIINGRQSVLGTAANKIVGGVRKAEMAVMNPGNTAREIVQTTVSKPLQTGISGGGWVATTMGYPIPGTTFGGIAAEKAAQKVPLYAKATAGAGKIFRKGGKVGNFVEAVGEAAYNTARIL